MKSSAHLFRALVIAAVLAPSYSTAQGLEGSFPQRSSSVSSTAAAFLDLGADDTDRANLVIPRSVGGGVTMVFTGSSFDPVSLMTSNQVGMRRMPGVGASIEESLATTMFLPQFGTIKAGVEFAGRICLLEKGFDGFALRPFAYVQCIDDAGVAAPRVATPDGVVNRLAGALAVQGGDLIVAGTLSSGGTTDPYELYLERRRASDLAVVGTRVTHAISLAATPVSDNFLEVMTLTEDAQGRWLVGGRIKRAPGSSSPFEAFLARFNADFSRDTGFGPNGVRNLSFGEGVGGQFFNANLLDVAVLDNGYIAAAGLGCKSVPCGTVVNGKTVVVEAITRVLDQNGGSSIFLASNLTADDVPRTVQVEATRAPYLPGNQTGFVLMEDRGNNTVYAGTFEVGFGGDVTSSGRFAFYGLQYSGMPATVVPQTFVHLATTRVGGRTRHYPAWTYLANTGNPSDTDMVMGEIESLAVFRDGFEG